MATAEVNLTDDQVVALRRLSQATGTPVTDLLAQSVAAFLASHTRPDRVELVQRALAMAGTFTAQSPTPAEQHDDALAALYAEHAE
jgi:hypothetical protein